MNNRKNCARCMRPASVCLCEYFVSVVAPCKVLILQHPSEQKQALATVPILRHCVTDLQVLVGETFSQVEVAAIIGDKTKCRILYPAINAAQWCFGEANSDDSDIETLIIIDGTWRKAKRIWHVNPWLHTLPCVCLTNLPKSEYQIRSSSIDGGVSTLETLVHACNHISASQDYSILLTPFRAMIDMQIKKMGLEIFQTHYIQGKA